MNCQKPLCRSAALWVPVVCVPTVRESSSGNMVETGDPTLLLMPEVCQRHKDDYNLTYWFPEDSWERMRAEAKNRGYAFPEAKMIEIQFRPVGWEPKNKYLEVER